METHYYSCAASVCAHMTTVSCAVATGGSSLLRCIFLHIEQIIGCTVKKTLIIAVKHEKILVNKRLLK